MAAVQQRTGEDSIQLEHAPFAPRALPSALDRLKEFPEVVGWVVAASADDFRMMVDEMATPFGDAELRPLMLLTPDDRAEILAWKAPPPRPPVLGAVERAKAA